MTFFSFTQALLSTPRAFSSHNLVGTRLKPACPWFPQLLFSRQALTPKASLAGLLSPYLEALAPGPEHREGAETINAVTISLHPRFTTNISGFPGRGQGSQRRAGESRELGHTLRSAEHTGGRRAHTVGSRLLRGTKPDPAQLPSPSGGRPHPPGGRRGPRAGRATAPQERGWVRLDAPSSLLPRDRFWRSALSKGAQSLSLSYVESTASEAPRTLTGRWLGCWTAVVEGTQVAATSPSGTRS